MGKRTWLLSLFLCAALLFTGCAMRTVDEMYAPPKRSEAYNDLQSVIDSAMVGLSYAAPNNGENQQTLQQADLDGDGKNEYLLFARGNSEKPMQILIFTQKEDSYQLSASIESSGFSFEQVEYVQIDGNPGMEIVVGRQVSDQLPKSLCVYSFATGQPEQLMSEGYAKFLTSDLNGDGQHDVLLLKSGETEADRGVAVRFSFENGVLERSVEADLSCPVDSVKRIMASTLESGEPAVYVASELNESAIITDVFALKNGRFTNISFSNDSGTSVQTLRNYYIYADDIDGDGVLELPSLITMKSLNLSRTVQRQYLIRWYAMDMNGGETDKLYTYHNFTGGWYLELDSHSADRISVSQDGSAYSFHLWDKEFETTQHLLTVLSLSGADREEKAQEAGRFVLHRGDGIVYAAELAPAAEYYEITQQEMISRFHLIHQEWKTGET